MQNDMKDKLIELKINFVENFHCGDCQPENDKCRKCLTEKEADYLLENGVIVPPCKVGDTVYFLRTPTHGGAYVATETVSCIDCYVTGCGVDFRISGGYFFAYKRDVGVTLFFDKEVAEQAVKERENNA